VNATYDGGMSHDTPLTPSPEQQSPPSGGPSVLPLVAVLALFVGVFGGLYALTAAQSLTKAHKLQSRNNMKRIGLGLFNYRLINRKLPAHAVYSPVGKPLLSWRVQLLPFLEETDQPGLEKEFHMEEPWDSPHNLALVARMPEVFANPDLDAEPGMTNYLAVVGENCAFDGTASGVPDDQVPDDRPRPILFVEADEAVPWTKPDDWEFDAANPTAGLGGFRGDVWLAARADIQIEEVPTQSPPPASDFERQVAAEPTANQ
jgi:hypothetical protein